jgi:hypothetical protein
MKRIIIKQTYPCNRPWCSVAFWDDETLTFSITTGSQMAVRLPALRACRALILRRFLVHISVSGWVDHRAIILLEGLVNWKHSDVIGNQTCVHLATLPRISVAKIIDQLTAGWLYLSCNPISFAICTNTFSTLCKNMYTHIEWHVEECSVALLSNK